MAGQQGASSNFFAGSLAAAGVVIAVASLDSPSNMSYGPLAGIADTQRLEKRLAEAEADTKYPGRTVNSAFVFVKPAAITPKTLALVEDKFRSFGVKITGSGSIDAKTIDKEQLIDTHYGAIAHKAMNMKAEELHVSEKAQAEFKAAVKALTCYDDPLPLIVLIYLLFSLAWSGRRQLRKAWCITLWTGAKRWDALMHSSIPSTGPSSRRERTSSRFHSYVYIYVNICLIASPSLSLVVGSTAANSPLKCSSSMASTWLCALSSPVLRPAFTGIPWNGLLPASVGQTSVARCLAPPTLRLLRKAPSVVPSTQNGRISS